MGVGAVISVGHEFDPFRYTIREVKAEEFARSIGDELRPLEDGGLEAPHGFVFFVVVQDSSAMFEELGFRWDRVLFGGMSLEYRRSLRVDETLTGNTCFSDYKERGEGDQRVGIVELETRYFGGDGEEALVEKSTVFARGGIDG